MFKDLFHTVKHSLIYSLGNLGIKLVGFILLPLYTSYLTTSDYGLLAIIEAISQFSIAILGFRLSTAMLRWASAEKDQHKQKEIIFTSLLSSLVVLLPFIISFFLFANYLSEVIFNSVKFTNYIYLISVLIIFEIYNIFLLDLLRLRDKSFLYISIVLVKLIFNLGLNIYFVAYCRLGVDGVVLSMVISSIVFSLVTLPFLISQIEFRFNVKVAIDMFWYGFPLIFATISSMVLTLSDRFVIKHFFNLSEVGIYNLGYKVSSVINVVIIQSFQMGFLPIAFKMFEKENAKEFFSKILTYFVFVLSFSIVAISLYSKELIFLLAKDINYYEAYKVVPILSATFLFKGIYYIFSLGLHYVKKTKYNSFIVVVGATINIILNFILVPFYNIYGAAFASVFSSLVICFLYYYFSQKLYYIKYELLRLVTLVSYSAVLMSAVYFINVKGIVFAILIKFFILLLFPVVLFLFGFFTNSEKNKLYIIIKYFPNITLIKRKLTNI